MRALRALSRAGKSNPSRSLNAHDQDPSPRRVLSRGRRDHRACRHLHLRGAARESHQHRACLRDELRLHHLPRDRAQGLRIAQRIGGRRGRSARSCLGPGAAIAAQLPGDTRPDRPYGRDSQVLDQSRQRKPLMTRQIVLDTETTGLSAENGDRIIELGCVELFNRKLTGNDLHIYFNPERESHEDALKVHGLTTDFLRDKPKFATLANDVVEYLRDADLIIHNAAFDVGFLNKELELAGLPPLRTFVGEVTDTLAMAKQVYPGK